MPTVAKIAARLRQRWHSARTAFSLRPQRYQVSYWVALASKINSACSIQLVVPMPVNRSTQRLLSSITFSQAPSSLATDALNGNRYAVWVLELAPQQRLEVRMNFTLAVEPANGSLPAVQELTEEPRQQWLRSSPAIDLSLPGVRQPALALSGGVHDERELAARLNAYVISKLAYGDPIAGLYTVAEALNRPRVDCGGFASLLVALCRSCGLPARIVSGFWAGYNPNIMHAWVEILLADGTWLPADPSVEHLRLRGQTVKRGQLGFTGSDRIALWVDCDTSIKMDGHSISVPILQHPYFFSSAGEGSVECQTTLLTNRL